MAQIAGDSVFVRHYQPDRRKWRARFVAYSMFLLAAVAVLIRLTIRDRWLPFASFHYATPPAVCAGMFLFAGIAAAIARRRFLAMASGVCAVATVGWFAQSPLFQGNDNANEAALNPTIRVLLWNMSSGEFGLEHVRDLIESYDADIVGLVESRSQNAWTQRWWEENFPEYRPCLFEHNLVLLSRLDVGAIDSGKLDELGHYGLAEIEVADQSLTVIHVDISHYVTSSRGPALAALNEFVADTPAEHLIVLGDFNTPPDSVHFAPLRKLLVNAFESAGAGYGATWPIPLPLLQLDQIWSRPPLEPSSCEVGWTFVSDHRPVVAVFSLGRVSVQ